MALEKIRHNLRLLRNQIFELPPVVTPCAVCGNVDLNWDRDWGVSDEEWKQVVPERWQDSTICPWCFVMFAAHRGKQYEVVYYRNIASGVKRVE